MTRAQILAAIAKIQALIADLQKQLAALTGSTTTFSCIQITKNLFYGMANDPQAVRCLQEVLISQGYAVTASGNYDATTKTAVAQFQQKYAGEILAPYHLTRGSGNVGNATRAKINSLTIQE
jgi:peptidoglycan hydrolase-like protein with peptidoglycan-binding domain